mgnify:CR=1 FL=1
MHTYTLLRRSHGHRVSQTIDSPILIFDFWELSDAFAALAIILVFGILFSAWGLMTGLLALTLVAGPVIRRRNKPGIFFHWPYRRLWISLPGLINPRGPRKFSD